MLSYNRNGCFLYGLHWILCKHLEKHWILGKHLEKHFAWDITHFFFFNVLSDTVNEHLAKSQCMSIARHNNFHLYRAPTYSAAPYNAEGAEIIRHYIVRNLLTDKTRGMRAMLIRAYNLSGLVWDQSKLHFKWSYMRKPVACLKKRGSHSKDHTVPSFCLHFAT